MSNMKEKLKRLDKEFRDWLRRLLFNLIREEIDLLITERLAPAPKELGWDVKIPLEAPKSEEIVRWQPHPSLPGLLLVHYRRPDGRIMKEAVPVQKPEDGRPINEYLLSVPHAKL